MWTKDNMQHQTSKQPANPSPKRYATLAFVITLTLSIGTLQAKSTSKSLDRIVAVVNNTIITDSELNHQTTFLLAHLQKTETELPPLTILKKQILEKMILQTLQLAMAEQIDIKVDQDMLNQAIQHQAKQEKLSLEAFKTSIEKTGISFKTFREQVKKELITMRLQQRVIGEQITISKVDVDNFLNSPVGQDKTGTEYHLSHILLLLPRNPSSKQLASVQAKAKKIIQQLNAGTKFSTLALEKSDGQQALKGGDLGWRTLNAMPTLFAPHLPAMQSGEILGPLRSNSGLHIIKLLGKRIAKESLESETHVKHILLKTGNHRSHTEAKKLLQNLRKKILAGASFDKLAKQHSDETRSAEKGGDLGWVTQSALLPAFQRRMNGLSPGDISQPFQSNLGWHLIQVLNRRTQQDSAQGARHKVKALLFQRKFEETLLAWLYELKENANVIVYF